MTISRPSSELTEQGPVDRLLREFFRQEMPHELPALRLPAPALKRRSRRALVSRLALAASVLFLLFGLSAAAELLPRSFNVSDPIPAPQNGSAMIRDSQGNPKTQKPAIHRAPSQLSKPR